MVTPFYGRQIISPALPLTRNHACLNTRGVCRRCLIVALTDCAPLSRGWTLRSHALHTIAGGALAGSEHDKVSVCCGSLCVVKLTKETYAASSDS